MRTVLTSIFLLMQVLSGIAQTGAKIDLTDLDRFTGNWTGTLTYIDYTSGKPFTMEAKAIVSRVGRSDTLLLANLYPNEPKANQTDTLVVSGNGTHFNRAVVIARNQLVDGAVEITTEETGTDGNQQQPALIRHIYTLGRRALRIRKDVQICRYNSQDYPA